MVWSLEEWSRKDMSSKAKVAHPERLRQAAWVSGPAALPPGCITMGKAQDFKNQCPRMAQDGCTFSLENQASHWTAPGAKTSLSRTRTVSSSWSPSGLSILI